MSTRPHSQFSVRRARQSKGIFRAWPRHKKRPAVSAHDGASDQEIFTVSLVKHQFVQKLHESIGVLQGTLVGQHSLREDEIGPLLEARRIGFGSGLLQKRVFGIDFEHKH